MEKWKDVPTWEGIYQCSNYGNVKRIFKYKDGRIVERILKPLKRSCDGYYQVLLCYKERQESWRLHRLIATVWQRPLLKTEDAHHKNRFKWCNCNNNIQIKDEKKHKEEHNIELWEDESFRNMMRQNAYKMKDLETGLFIHK